MGQSPGRFAKDLLVAPFGMRGAEMDQEHAACRLEHVIGDGQTLGAGHLAADFGHLIVHDLDLSGV
jgi:hypothetical protein